MHHFIHGISVIFMLLRLHLWDNEVHYRKFILKMSFSSTKLRLVNIAFLINVRVLIPAPNHPVHEHVDLWYRYYTGSSIM